MCDKMVDLHMLPESAQSISEAASEEEEEEDKPDEVLVIPDRRVQPKRQTGIYYSERLCNTGVLIISYVLKHLKSPLVTLFAVY